MNRLFCAYKPPFISSHTFLKKLKKKYSVKKAGFSGTLDPIAKGVLIVAFGQYTKFFRFLKKTPKTYKTTLWIGAFSEGFDIEKVKSVEIIPKLELKKIEQEIKNLEKLTSQTPPKYSAKWIDGERAYDLARRGEEVKMKSIPIAIYKTKFINYSHPFITFEATVSEGTYIRSLGQTLCHSLGSFGVLSSLERLQEGLFEFENERALDVAKYIDLKSNTYNGDLEDLILGKKLKKEAFENSKNDVYRVIQKDMISIIEISDEKVSYCLNRIERF